MYDSLSLFNKMIELNKNTNKTKDNNRSIDRSIDHH